MSAGPDVDVMVRVGEWIPTLVFLLRVYAEDQDTALGMLQPGMPLFDAAPIDLNLAWLMVVDMVASIGNVSPQDLTDLLLQVGGHLMSQPPTQGDTP